MKTNYPIFVAILIVLLLSCQQKESDWTWSSGVNLTKRIDKNGVSEMSGLHWNQRSHRLYAISDNGNLAILQLDTATESFSKLAELKELGQPEGVTQVDDAANDFYTIDENTCEIRKYTHENDYTSVRLTTKWDLTRPPSNMATKKNQGPEGIEFIPDSYLNAIGFISSETNEKYSSVKGMHGLFFIAHQHNGLIWVYDVNPAQSDDYIFVGKYKTSKSESCELTFDRSTGLLYILHNTGGNSLEITNLSTSLKSNHYKFITKFEYAVPNPVGNKNVEGFALSPQKASIDAPSYAWFCRDIADNEKGHERKDCLRWFKHFNEI